MKSGNRFGHVLLPLDIAIRGEPLDYIRRAKASVDRKKLSYEAICTFAAGVFMFKCFGLKVRTY